MLVFYDGNAASATFSPNDWPEGIEVGANWGNLGADLNPPYLRMSGQKQNADDWVSALVLPNTSDFSAGSFDFTLRSGSSIPWQIQLEDVLGRKSAGVAVVPVIDQAQKVVLPVALFLTNSSFDISHVAKVYFNVPAHPAWNYAHNFLDNIRLEPCSGTQMPMVAQMFNNSIGEFQ